MNKEKNRKDSRHLERWLTYGIPVVSFGGILAAILLQETGVIADAGTFAWGCVAGSFMLGYLAYIKPRKDIVALCAPIYGVLFFHGAGGRHPSHFVTIFLRSKHHRPSDPAGQKIQFMGGRQRRIKSHGTFSARLYREN